MPILIAAVSLVLVISCTSSPTAPDEALRGGVVATFDVSGERFNVWITDAQAIAQVLALQRGESQATIPNGRLRLGSGQGNHNSPYSWHLDPEDIAMAEATIELCDGRPSFVEANRNQFVQQVGRYCPWGARLERVQDHR